MPAPPPFLPLPARGAGLGPAGGPFAKCLEKHRALLSASLVDLGVPCAEVGAGCGLHTPYQVYRDAHAMPVVLPW